MSLLLLFKDELKGFYRSNVMLFLWVGLPLISLLMRLWSPDTGDEIPFSLLTALLVSSIGGTLAAVMLAVSIINEKNRRVYDLFLIRPIRRRDMLMAKFFAVYLCLVGASLLAMGLGQGIEYFTNDMPLEQITQNSWESLAVSLSMMAIASSVGILIGVISPSVLVGAILVIYGGNQISALPILPTMLGVSEPLIFTAVLGAILTAVFLSLSFILFERKQF
jgi:ABC-2 type transport system permease protein